MCSKEQLPSDLLLGVAFHHNIKRADPSLASARCSWIEIEGKIRSCSFGLLGSAASHSFVSCSAVSCRKGPTSAGEYLLTSRFFLSFIFWCFTGLLEGGGEISQKIYVTMQLAKPRKFQTAFQASCSDWFTEGRESYFQPRCWWLIRVLIITGECLTDAS